MAYYPQHCDSYFVESHDDRERRYRDEIREQERLAKRQMQVAIAEQLSDIASQEYRDDHLKQMEKQEVKRLKPFDYLPSADTKDRSRLSQMSHQLTSKQRFNGICGHICLTS